MSDKAVSWGDGVGGTEGQSMRQGFCEEGDREAHIAKIWERQTHTQIHVHTHSVLNDLRDLVLLYCFLN